jgi:hypothetical protein
MAWYSGSLGRDLLAVTAYIGGVAGLVTAVVIGAASLIPERSGQQAVAETTGASSQEIREEHTTRTTRATPAPIVEHRPAADAARTPAAAPRSTPTTNYAATAKKKAQEALGKHRQKKRSAKRPRVAPAAGEAMGYAPRSSGSFQ